MSFCSAYWISISNTQLLITFSKWKRNISVIKPNVSSTFYCNGESRIWKNRYICFMLIKATLRDMCIGPLDVLSTYSDFPSLTLAFLITPKFPRPNFSNNVIDSRGKIISFPIQVGISQLIHSILSNFGPTKLNQKIFWLQHIFHLYHIYTVSS